MALTPDGFEIPDESGEADEPKAPKEPSRDVVRWEAQFRASVLPSPDDLERYQKLIPDCGNRMLVVREEQQRHRMRLEWTMVIHTVWKSYLGMGTGFIIGLAGLYFSYLLGMAGHEIPSATLGTGGLAALVGVFVYGEATQRRERKEKLQALTQRIPTVTQTPPSP